MYFLKYILSRRIDDMVDGAIPGQDYLPYGPAEYGPIKFVWLNLLVLAADIFGFDRFIPGAPKIWWLVGTLLVADAVAAAVNLLRREVASSEVNYYTNNTRVVIKEGSALGCPGNVIQFLVPVVYFFIVLVTR